MEKKHSEIWFYLLFIHVFNYRKGTELSREQMQKEERGKENKRKKEKGKNGAQQKYAQQH